MSAEALNYQINKTLGSNSALRVYYDFSSGSVYAASGGNYQAYLRNVAPSSAVGSFDGRIIGATGATSGAATTLATGSGGFILNESGNFTKNYLQVNEGTGIDLKNSSFLFFIDSELSNDGVIFGSLEKSVTSVGGNDVVSSKGFNFGLTARGKLFFQSLGEDGEYCFVMNSSELSKKNIVGLNFSNSEVKLFRFDYLNEEIESESFQAKPQNIGNTTGLYLGASPTYWRAGNQGKLFSGHVNKFAAFSGQIPESTLFEIGKGLFSDYYYDTGSITSGLILSGYVPTLTYKTGVTGKYANITGYAEFRSGIDEFSQSVIHTGNLQVREGDRFFKNYSTYLEEQGYLNPAYQNTYAVSGDSAHATLGLRTGETTISGYSISGDYPYSTINVPLYEIVDMTGTTTEISGIANVPVYNTVFATGLPSSGILFSGNSEGFNKNYIHYLGRRI